MDVHSWLADTTHRPSPSSPTHLHRPTFERPPSSSPRTQSTLSPLLAPPFTYALGPRSLHSHASPTVSHAVAPASFSSASDILSSIASSSSSDDEDGQEDVYDDEQDEEDDLYDGEGLRIDDIQEELSDEDEGVSWSARSVRHDADGLSSSSLDDDQRLRPPLRGRRSRDFSSESTHALLARQEQQSFESKRHLMTTNLKPSHIHSDHLCPPSLHASLSPECQRRSRSRTPYARPGSPIVESATSASDESPPRPDAHPHQPPCSPRSFRAVTPPGRSVRFNPRMKTRTAYGSYQSDQSIDLVSQASPARSFISWRYPRGKPKRSGSVLSAKRAPAVASWTNYYGALDNGLPAGTSDSPYAYQPSPFVAQARTEPSPVGSEREVTSESFGHTLWDRLGKLDYWLWKTGLDDWSDGGCCLFPTWADEEEWMGNASLAADRRRGIGIGESRPTGLF